MRRVEFHSIAESELVEVLEWYSARSYGTARRFLARCGLVLEAIRREPDRFPRVGRTLRRARLGGFPYAVYYRPGKSAVVIVGIIHNRRDPVTLQGREP